MGKVSIALTCDGCDGKLTNDDILHSERQRRFLDAYRQRPIIALAARLADVHRATVYRWLADPTFTNAMRVATEAYYRAHREKVRADEATRRRWRDARERERRAMRCDYLERARDAKYQRDVVRDSGSKMTGHP